MKSAPLVAGSALGLLLLALATAHPSAPLWKIVPLDFTGIETIEIHGASPQIQISSRQAPQASYVDEPGETLDVRRTGSRLMITVHSGRYPGAQFSVPASVRAIAVEDADIEARERLRSMQVSASSAVTWKGDIDRLDLRDSADHAKHTDADCDCADPTVFSVTDGRIADLRVRSSYASLRLSKPDKIDTVYAWLGEKGGVTLENARRFDNIHVLPTEAQLPDASSPKPSADP